jgi:hypothetical protein
MRHQRQQGKVRLQPQAKQMHRTARQPLEIAMVDAIRFLQAFKTHFAKASPREAFNKLN